MQPVEPKEPILPTNRKYFEMFELQEDGSKFPDQVVRLQIEEDEDAPPLLEAYRVFFEKGKYIARRHECKHDTGEPCNVTTLEQVLTLPEE